jgi:hypothetical protein
MKSFRSVPFCVSFCLQRPEGRSEWHYIAEYTDSDDTENIFQVVYSRGEVIFDLLWIWVP